MKGPAERPLHVASPARRRHILRSDSAKYVRCGDFVDALRGRSCDRPLRFSVSDLLRICLKASCFVKVWREKAAEAHLFRIFEISSVEPPPLSSGARSSPLSTSLRNASTTSAVS